MMASASTAFDSDPKKVDGDNELNITPAETIKSPPTPTPTPKEEEELINRTQVEAPAAPAPAPVVDDGDEEAELNRESEIVLNSGQRQPETLDTDPSLLKLSDHDSRQVVESEKSSPPEAKVKEKKLTYYLPLYHAAKEGKWKNAESFIERDPDALTAVISVSGMNALHVAASFGRSEFIEKLVELMPAEALGATDKDGCTAMHFIATCGTVKAARTMVSKRSDLPNIVADNGLKPLHHAAFYCGSSHGYEMLWYLCEVTSDDQPQSGFSTPLAAGMIYRIIISGYYVIPGKLDHEQLRPVGRDMEDPIQNLRDVGVQMSTPPQPISKFTQDFKWFGKMVWTSIVRLTPCLKRLHDAKLRHECLVELFEFVCEQALEMDNDQTIIKFFLDSMDSIENVIRLGVVEIVTEYLKYFPDIVRYFDNKSSNIFHYAIQHRQHKIYNVIIEESMKDTTIFSTAHRNILHEVAKLAPPPQLNSISGSAFQMQRELQWFKEVESLVLLSGSATALNAENKTAQEVFTEEHKSLRKEGEKWLKDTSNSCMVVSTLISTVVFAATFTVPGGNLGDKGIPIFLNKTSFMVFAISDSLALLSSLTSLILFLSMLTSRYAEEDFLMALPKRMIMGLASLFIAIATMMVAFGATLCIVLSERLAWISIPISVLACVPVILFARIQLPLLIQMVLSTYGPSIFRRRQSDGK